MNDALDPLDANRCSAQSNESSCTHPPFTALLSADEEAFLTAITTSGQFTLSNALTMYARRIQPLNERC